MEGDSSQPPSVPEDKAPEQKSGKKPKHTSDGYNRKDKSLALLCENFVARYGHTAGIVVNVDKSAEDLGVERRRIYDIINVLEALSLMEKQQKNAYVWLGNQQLPTSLETLMREGISEIENGADMLDDRKEKTLTRLTQRIVQMFLMSKHKAFSLDDAAKCLLPDVVEQTQYKTKVRRLYDIANILCSISLIQKTTLGEKGKPGFIWVGPLPALTYAYNPPPAAQTEAPTANGDQQGGATTSTKDKATTPAAQSNEGGDANTTGGGDDNSSRGTKRQKVEDNTTAAAVQEDRPPQQQQPGMDADGIPGGLPMLLHQMQQGGYPASEINAAAAMFSQAATGGFANQPSSMQKINPLKRFVELEEGLAEFNRPQIMTDMDPNVWSANAWQQFINPAAAALGGMYSGFFPGMGGADGQQQQQLPNSSSGGNGNGSASAGGNGAGQIKVEGGPIDVDAQAVAAAMAASGVMPFPFGFPFGMGMPPTEGMNEQQQQGDNSGMPPASPADIQASFLAMMGGDQGVAAAMAAAGGNGQDPSVANGFDAQFLQHMMSSMYWPAYYQQMFKPQGGPEEGGAAAAGEVNGNGGDEGQQQAINAMMAAAAASGAMTLPMSAVPGAAAGMQQQNANNNFNAAQLQEFSAAYFGQQMAGAGGMQQQQQQQQQ